MSRRPATTVAALYVFPDGPYSSLRGVEPWDEKRDARRYRGPHPVVAHPPCVRWSVLAYSVQARYPHCKIGDDGGCFEAALRDVRRWGGVLEHPSRSLAFGKKHGFDLGRPRRGSWQETGDGGWITEVSQAAYGHQAEKLTWLLYYGIKPPPKLDWSKPQGTHQISYGKKADGKYWLPPLTKKEGKKTPPRFRELLLKLARGCGGTNWTGKSSGRKLDLDGLLREARASLGL